MVHKVFIGLGSNIGDGKKTLLSAWETICQKTGVEGIRLSSPYVTSPVGMKSDNYFTNAVAEFTTSLDPDAVLEMLLEVEDAYGRERQPGYPGYVDRTLDLDILLFNDMISESSRLNLPHPKMGERLFVLEPLAEIAPELEHPVAHKTIIAIRDSLQVQSAKIADQQVKKECWEA